LVIGFFYLRKNEIYILYNNLLLYKMYSYYNNVCLAEKCDCVYNENTNNLEILCLHCKKNKEKELKINWYLEINTIQKYLNYCEIDNIDLRIIYIKEMFEFLLSSGDFIATHPRFRAVLLSKINQFKNEKEGKELYSLCDNLNNFIKSLENKDNYIQ